MFLEEKTKRYPYMKVWDMYAQPSRFEELAVTVREAQILSEPVLITNFPTAKSQLEDGVDGMICPLSVDGVADAIKMLIEHPELRDRLSETCASRDYGNQAEVEKSMRLCDEDS
ncbi:glycosyltransferase [Akkermansiaceae bacterium]|nr:glycosyltransferase [Akkermansiaceae bacterium]MDB4695330.1 glycosyltransferase [Akkermansiaceae bacterium]